MTNRFLICFTRRDTKRGGFESHVLIVSVDPSILAAALPAAVYFTIEFSRNWSEIAAPEMGLKAYRANLSKSRPACVQRESAKM